MMTAECSIMLEKYGTTNKRPHNENYNDDILNEHENDKIKLMISARCRIDELLTKVAASFSYQDIYGSLSFNSKHSICLKLTTCNLNSLKTSLDEASTIDDIKQLVQKIDSTSDTQLESELIEFRSLRKPFILTPSAITSSSNNLIVLELPDEKHVRRELGKKNLTIIIQNLLELPREIPDDEFCIDDELLYDRDKFQKLKDKNRDEWERRMGKFEYCRLSLRIFQLVSDLDLQVKDRQIENIASRALLISSAWRSGFVQRASLDTVKKIFGKHPTGKFILVPSDTNHIVQCHIGSRSWSKYHHGIGMILESHCNINVYWKPTSEDNSNSILSGADPLLNCTNHILSAACTVVQGFVLVSCDQHHSICFSDCNASDETISVPTHDTLIPDSNLGYVKMRFEHTNDKTNLTDLKNWNDNHDDTNHLILDRDKNKKYKQAVSLTETVKIVNSRCKNKVQYKDIDIYAWGGNPSNCLGIQSDGDGGIRSICFEPERVLFRPISPIEAVKTIECSSCHTLVLTTSGLLYSCGDGSEGQLGHNSVDSCRYLRLIESFRQKPNGHISITQISAGSDGTSSHSAAIDSNHVLYTWGSFAISGHAGGGPGIDEAMSTHKRSNFKKSTNTTYPRQIIALEEYSALQVSCGGSFTLVRATKKSTDEGGNNEILGMDTDTERTHIFSWGLMAHGRLGLGRPKARENASLRGGQIAKNVTMYQSRPTVVPAFTNLDIVGISAGKKHALAISADGSVFSWGSNSAGECSVVSVDPNIISEVEERRCNNRYDGVENTPLPSLWDDVWTPRRVVFRNNIIVVAKSVSAGGIHSAAVDSRGIVYTWGGGGQGSCLGHGDIPQYKFGMRDKEDAYRRQQLALAGCLTPPNWAQPRPIGCLSHEYVSKVSLGEMHGSIVTLSGSLYTWGDGIPELQKTNSIRDSMLPKEKIVKKESLSQEPLFLPLKPSTQCLKILAGKQVNNVVCGGHNTFCMVSGDNVQSRVCEELFQECVSQEARISFEMNNDNKRPLKSTTEDASQSTVDCIILAGGRRLYCHKVILAQRSTALKAMIAAERRPQDPNSVVEIIIPGIHSTTAKSVVRFIYTDSVTRKDLNSLALTANLRMAAKKLDLPKLVFICDQFAESNAFVLCNETEQATDPLSCPPSTISVDLGRALDDSSFADVQIMTQDKTVILAHKCILRCSSEHFRMILNYSQKQSKSMFAYSTIELPATHSEVLRMLFYLYTGTLMCGTSQDDMRTDLINANRYNMLEMKVQCENAIEVTTENAISLLHLSLQVDSSRLKTESIYVISKNLSNYVHNFTLLDFPSDVIGQLFDSIVANSGIYAIIPKYRRDKSIFLMKRKRQIQAKVYNKMVANLIGGSRREVVRQVTTTAVLFVIGIGYMQLLRIVKVGPMIPLINISVLAISVIHLFKKIK